MSFLFPQHKKLLDPYQLCECIFHSDNKSLGVHVNCISLGLIIPRGFPFGKSGPWILSRKSRRRMLERDGLNNSRIKNVRMCHYLKCPSSPVEYRHDMSELRHDSKLPSLSAKIELRVIDI